MCATQEIRTEKLSKIDRLIEAVERLTEVVSRQTLQNAVPFQSGSQGTPPAQWR